MASWVDLDNGSGFSLDMLPYGIFSTDSLDARIGVAIGAYILDLKALAQDKVFAAIALDTSVMESSTLNAFAAVDREIQRQIRCLLQDLLARDTRLGSELRDHHFRRETALVQMSKATMHLPMDITNYTDFFVGKYHAENAGDAANIVRPDVGLHPNYSSLPVGYAGHASSIVVSGTPIQRPKGQYLKDGKVFFGPSQKLDFEVEFAAFVGRGNRLGTSISVNDAEDHIFGFVLMNDWSARDIQQWESTPLGPFNAKNFGVTISPWVVPLEALEPVREFPLAGGPYLPYLHQEKENSVYNVSIDVTVEDESGKYHIFTCNTKNILFSFAQMLAHHTIGGCPMRNGDLIATGTLSGPSLQELGCFFEATKNGTEPYEVDAGAPGKPKLSRRFLHDGDIIAFTALGFGTCSGRVLAAT